jgi:hypothetical protein
LWKVDTELAVIVLGLTDNPAGTAITFPNQTDALAWGWRFARRLASQRRDDETFKALFAGVGGHA